MTTYSTQHKLRFWLTGDSFLGCITFFLWVFHHYNILHGAWFWLSFPIFLATIATFYHYMRRNHNYIENRMPPKYVLENLRCVLIYRAIIIAIFGVISAIVLLWGLILYFTEGAEAKKAADSVGMGEKAGGIINAIFSKPLEYSAIETFLLGFLAVGEFFMIKFSNELINHHRTTFEA